MTPVEHIEKAKEAVAFARFLLVQDAFTDQAGRAAYMAAFHAALALIVYRTGKEPKTHRGTHVEFARIIHKEQALEQSFVAFLSSSYDLKTAADYDSLTSVELEDFGEMVDTAERIVRAVAALLPTASGELS